MSGALLVRALRDPASVLRLDGPGWNALIAVARAEQAIGTLAYRVVGLALPPAAGRVMADARDAAEQGRRAALWERHSPLRGFRRAGAVRSAISTFWCRANESTMPSAR